MSIGYIKPVVVPRDPEDRKPDEPINLYFGDQFSMKALAPEYKQASCPDSIENFVFHLELANIPYKIVITSRPEFALLQYMYRTDNIYPMSVGESKLNVVRENKPNGIPIGDYVKQEYQNGNPDFFEVSEYALHESEPKVNDEGKLSYGNEKGSFPALAVLFTLATYAIAANYIRANLTHDDLMRLDRNNGILFSVDENGQLHHKIVSGSDRPDLAAIVIKDGSASIEKCRPYYEDSELGKTLDSALGIGQVFPFGLDGDDDEEDMSLDNIIFLAEAGNIEMMARLMQAYIQGDEELDLEEDPEKACYWMKRIAEAGEPIGSFNLALHYAKGYGVPRDFEQAVYWMEKAAEQGDEDAPEAAEHYRRIAQLIQDSKAGNAQAQADLAGEYVRLGGSLNEAGPGKDYEEAFFWAQKSADSGNLDGMYVLALCHDHGRGTKEDPKKAFSVFEDAAKKGHAPSMWNLAYFYLQGRGTWKNDKKAFEWAQKSADLGNALAIAGIAHMYEEGRGVKEDLNKAIEWYEKALEVEPENVQVQHAIALAYLTPGENGDREALKKAMYWFKKAADNGDDMCDKQYTLWSYVMKQNDGLIPEDFDFSTFVPETARKAQNGDPEAQEVIMKCFM